MSRGRNFSKTRKIVRGVVFFLSPFFPSFFLNRPCSPLERGRKYFITQRIVRVAVFPFPPFLFLLIQSSAFCRVAENGNYLRVVSGQFSNCQTCSQLFSLSFDLSRCRNCQSPTICPRATTSKFIIYYSIFGLQIQSESSWSGLSSRVAHNVSACCRWAFNTYALSHVIKTNK
jgi:hypothetical protein